ncbi:hypothetical protein [Streptomyces silvisoli]|uniref:Cardiolipin synthase N-terminal domain-containing protein n=1 Tax=Streptomyces silvisoli TaxID=3034235 RepID=A0ABT5ZWH1_9ACTN|nr:hypothetical protein [Streptomyces silvisoli]MDF3294167.1 hypothetical protein [Streptomyces silvisoli]
MASKRKPNKLVLAVFGGLHATAMALTWRDLRKRPPALIRGNKKIWRIASTMNTGGAAAYWLIGRRRTPAPAKH